MKLMRCGLVLTVIAMIALPAMSIAEESDASISWSAWGRGIFVPVAHDGDGDSVPRDVASWGGHSRLGFTIKGESERAGFWVDMNADSGSLGMQDQQKIWIKPMSILTVEVGPTVFYDTLRGNTAFGSWDWWRFSGILGEDNVFLRGSAGGGDGKWNCYGARGAGGRYSTDYEADPEAGAIVHVDTNGFHAYASWNIVEEGRGFYTDPDDEDTEYYREKYTSELMFKRGQYGVGYEIPDFGLVRAQVFGKAYMKEGKDYTEGDELETYHVLNAALKIDQLIENLYLDMGVFISSDDDAENSRAAIYANYKMGSVTPHLLIGTEFDQDKFSGSGSEMGLKLGLGADVDLGSDLTLNLDLRFHNETAAEYEDGQIACLIGIKKGFSNGLIGIGFQGTTQNWGGDSLVKEENDDDFLWALPIKLEYWF